MATFVWSHLSNLEQSSLPSRVEIQGLLSGNPMPQLQDDPDFRLFSRNYEQSVFFDQYNAGKLLWVYFKNRDVKIKIFRSFFLG